MKVVVIDDHLVVADTLAATLNDHRNIEVVGVAGDGSSGIALVQQVRPDVVIVDFRLPDLSGAEVIRRLMALDLSCRCVVLTGTGLGRALLDAVEAGAVGFVTKNQRYTEVVDAILAAAAGEVRFPPAMLAEILPDLRKGNTAGRRLSDREREVLNLLAEGSSNSEIAERLFISTNTVRSHVANLLMKLEAGSRGEAVARAIREGLVRVEGD